MRYINVDIVAAGKFHYVDAVDRDSMNQYRRGWNDALDAVINDSEGAWIPVSDRLPVEDDYRECHENADGAVLWCTSDGLIGVGWRYDSTGNWVDANDVGIENVIAWMPIPAPYGGET